MIVVKYPSREFDPFARTAIEDGKTFCVDARLGRFRKKSLKDYIDFNFGTRAGRFSYIGVAMCGMLAGLTAKASLDGRYRVSYSETKRGLLITFMHSGFGGQAPSAGGDPQGSAKR